MFKTSNYSKTQISCNEAYYAESIEQKMRKVMAGAETAEETAQIIYTDRKDGVLPEYDIRTDRFDVALEASDKCHKTDIARREEAMKAETEEFTDVTPK